jgi:hypothetical protein
VLEFIDAFRQRLATIATTGQALPVGAVKLVVREAMEWAVGRIPRLARSGKAAAQSGHRGVDFALADAL